MLSFMVVVPSSQVMLSLLRLVSLLVSDAEESPDAAHGLSLRLWLSTYCHRGIILGIRVLSF